MNTTMGRFERVLKDLDRLATYAKRGAQDADTLEAKLAGQRVYRCLIDARAIIRPIYYELEDTIRAIKPGAQEGGAK
jgi:hypothetical protein